MLYILLLYFLFFFFFVRQITHTLIHAYNKILNKNLNRKMIAISYNKLNVIRFAMRAIESIDKWHIIGEYDIIFN